MIVQHLLTDHFGEGLCLYVAEFDKPEDYEGDMNKKVGGPYASEQEVEAALTLAGIEEYNIL